MATQFEKQSTHYGYHLCTKDTSGLKTQTSPLEHANVFTAFSHRKAATI